jgi:hypothetical protein
MKLIAFCVIFALTPVALIYAQSGTENERPMTTYEKEMLRFPTINQLKSIWDTLSTDYDRQYFLNGVPGYCYEKKIKDLPAWVSDAVIQGLKSNDPNFMCAAIALAGQFKLNCANELTALYPSINGSIGSHEDVIKGSIINALNQMSFRNKEAFYYSILVQDRLPLSSVSFEALVAALQSTPHKMFINKLEEYRSQADVMIEKIENDPADKRPMLQQVKDVKEKIIRALNKCNEK